MMAMVMFSAFHPVTRSVMIILMSDIQLTMRWPQGTQAAVRTTVVFPSSLALRVFFNVLSIFHPCVLHVPMDKM
jgi:hypothetical protein